MRAGSRSTAASRAARIRFLFPRFPFPSSGWRPSWTSGWAAAPTSTLIVVAEGARAEGGEFETLHVDVKGRDAPRRHRSTVWRTRLRNGPGERRAPWCSVTSSAAGRRTTLDRILGTRFGVGAVQLIQDGKFGHMVSYLNYQDRRGDDQGSGRPAQVRPPRRPDGRDGQGDGRQLRDVAFAQDDGVYKCPRAAASAASFSASAWRCSAFLLTHASHDLPSAVSRPVKAIDSMSA